MKKISAVFIILLFLMLNIFFLVIPAKSDDLSLWPGKLTIDLSEFPDGEIEYNQISVTNPYDHEIEVIVEITDAPPGSGTEGYSNIPNLSWVSVTPSPSAFIPADSKGFFELEITIPEAQKALHYNESWEIWIKFFKKPEFGEGTLINVKLASKIFIHTPASMKQDIPYNPLFFILIFGGLFLLIIVYLYIKTRHSIGSNRRAMYYIKKKNK